MFRALALSTKRADRVLAGPSQIRLRLKPVAAYSFSWGEDLGPHMAHRGASPWGSAMTTCLYAATYTRAPARIAILTVVAMVSFGCEGQNSAVKERVGMPAHEAMALVFQIDNTEVRIPLDQLTYYRVRGSERDKLPDGFVLDSEIAALAGAFWIGFDGNHWEKLVDKPMKILARAGPPVNRQSHITLPNEGETPVTGGSLLVKKVERFERIIVLSGNVTLEFQRAGKPVTVSGTFRAQVDGPD